MHDSRAEDEGAEEENAKEDADADAEHPLRHGGLHPWEWDYSDSCPGISDVTYPDPQHHISNRERSVFAPANDSCILGVTACPYLVQQ